MVLTSNFDPNTFVMHRQQQVLELVEAVGLQLEVVAQLSFEQLRELGQ